MSLVSFKSLSPRQREILYSDIYHLFFSTAEADYVAARLLWHNYLPRAFCWAAAQAIEKYVKCSLLLNGYNVKKVGHDFTSVFEKVKLYANKLIPQNIEIPKIIIDEFKKEFSGSIVETQPESWAACLKRFQENGSPDGRYNESPMDVGPFEIQKLDQIVFYLRRVCIDLSSREIGQQNLDALLRDLLWRPELDLQPHPLSQDLNAAKCFKNRNFAFFTEPENFEPRFLIAHTIGSWEPYRNDVDAKVARTYLNNNAKLSWNKSI